MSANAPTKVQVEGGPIHKHIAQKKYWPKQETNPLAGGEGYAPRQKSHFPELSNRHSAVPAAAEIGIFPTQPSLPQLGSPKRFRTGTAPDFKSRTLSSSSSSASSSSSSASPSLSSSFSASFSSSSSSSYSSSDSPNSAKQIQPIGIAPGVFGNPPPLKSGLRLFSAPPPKPEKVIVKKLLQPSGESPPKKIPSKRTFPDSSKLTTEEKTIEDVVGRKRRGYSLEEKRNGIPMKKEGDKPWGNTGEAFRTSVSPNKAQKARELAAVVTQEAIINRKTYAQKLEEEQFLEDVRNVESLPESLVATKANPHDFADDD